MDALTGGAISTFATTTAISGAASLSAFGSSTYVSVTATAMAASSMLSPIDFFISLGKDASGNHQAMQNWWNLTWGQFGSIATMFSYDKNAHWYEWPLQVINNLTGGEVLQDYVGKTLGHALNIDGKIETSGFYKGRLIGRLNKNSIPGEAISLGHFIYGEDIALNPWDWDHNVNLFAHEYGHTYESRITGPLYLFRYGIASVYDNNGYTELDATRRGSSNLGITITNTFRFPSGTSTYKLWEHALAPVLYPFMWLWNY